MKLHTILKIECGTCTSNVNAVHVFFVFLVEPCRIVPKLCWDSFRHYEYGGQFDRIYHTLGGRKHYQLQCKNEVTLASSQRAKWLFYDIFHLLFQQTLESWRTVFLITAAFYIIFNTIFVIFVRAEIQPWNTYWEQNNDTKSSVKNREK